MSNVSLIDGHIDEPKCDFCRNYNFARAKAEVIGNDANIYLSLCNSKFPKEQQFKYCPVCGRKL